MDVSKRLSDNARTALAHAEILARLSDARTVDTGHLLLALLSQQQSVAARLLMDCDIDPDVLRSAIKLRPGIVVATGPNSMDFSEAMKLTLRMAVEIASEAKQDCCGTVHLLYSLLSQRDSRAVEILSNQNIDVDELVDEVSRHLEDGTLEYAEAGDDTNEKPRQGRSYIDRFGTDLTKEAREGKLDPVIGRSGEIDRLITIISRRTKNNPVLIGEAGVGKTAIVEGLAQRITDRQVPDFLADRRLVELDLAAIVAGTKYRGEFEERLKRVIDEVTKDDKLIVFIDEIHLLVGAGAGSGTMDAANLLKPALARGKFRLIGATTVDEYRKNIEKDAALTRRLQEIIVDAPSSTDTAKILTGIADRYEQYHHVKISPLVIKEVVRLSDRYIADRQQPDKAIDVLDETAARVRIAAARSKQTVELQDYQTEVDHLSAEMDKAAEAEDYEKAALYKMRVSQLKSKIEELKQQQAQAGLVSIKVNDVAATVSRMTGVPLEQLQRSEAAKLTGLEKRLSKRIIGQSQAVTAVAQAIRRSRAGIADPRRPIGSFIFLGPTGVGKTELAKVLSDEVFGSVDNLIKVDMSEFGEKHTVSRLVGAPAGYVGYDDGGQLTERVRRQPYSVVLFDEIEKAHPDVFNILLQILEDGVLTDGHGKKVDFRNCVIILTSNVGVAELAGEPMGFAVAGEELAENTDARRQKVMKALQHTMRPELLNRFDQIILFNELSTAEIGNILDLMVVDLNERLAGKGIAVTIAPRLRRHLMKVGYDAKYGARPMRRVIQDTLERVLADQLISGQIKRGDILRADWLKGEVVLNRQTEKSAKIMIHG